MPIQNKESAWALIGMQGDHAGKTLLLELNRNLTNDVVQQLIGMGKTGETYLVGGAAGATEMRSDRVVKSNKLGESKGHKTIDWALEGKQEPPLKSAAGKMEIVSYYTMCPTYDGVLLPLWQ